LQKITDFFKYIFEENFLNGPDPAQKENGPKSAQNKMGLLSTGAGLSPTAWAGLGSSPKQVWTGYCTPA